MAQIQRVLRLVLTFAFVCHACGVIVTPEELEQLQLDVLAKHNSKRAKHGVPPLVLNAELNAKSQARAEKMLKEGIYKTENNIPEGQNIYMGISNDHSYLIDGKAVVSSWYSESDSYSQEDKTSAGHFSQVVWKSTTDLGVGWAVGEGYNIVVCDYWPPGNIEGQYDENVLPRI